MTEKINELNEIQKYIIGGFIEYGHAQDYKDVLPSKIFGVYEPLFLFLAEYGNVKNPDFYAICGKIGNKNVIAAMDRATHTFLMEKDKFIEKLFNIYISDSISKELSPIEVLEKVRETYIKLSYIKNESKGGIARIDTLLSSLLDEVAEACEYGDTKPGYTTGVPTLDKYIGGLVKGRTVRLSAYSNTGKSAFSYAITNHVLNQGAKVLYFSLEIPKEDLRNRLLSNHFNFPIHNFDKKSSLSKLDFTEYSKKQLYLSSDSFTMSEIEKLTQSIKPDIVFIDYVQLVKGEGNSEYEQMNDVARRIRKLSSDNNVAVFDLSQVSNEGKEYRKGALIPSKGSGELVSAANVVLVMTESKLEGRLNLHIAKNRHGIKGKCIELKPKFSTSYFEDCGEIDPDNKNF